MMLDPQSSAFTNSAIPMSNRKQDSNLQIKGLNALPTELIAAIDYVGVEPTTFEQIDPRLIQSVSISVSNTYRRDRHYGAIQKPSSGTSGTCRFFSFFCAKALYL